MSLHDPFPERGDGSSRREFLRRIGLGAGVAALAWPRSLEALAAKLPANGPGGGSGLALRATSGRAESVRPETAARGGPGDEEFWRLVRQEFLIPEDRLYINVGTLGPQPRVVFDAAVEDMRRVAMTYPPGVDWKTIESGMGELLHGDADGFVFPRNTTEAMNFVANGLELRSGDEILTTDHEHIGGLCCWQLQAKRRGLVLRQLPLPVPPSDPEQVVEIFRRAITPRTRVISLSHVTFTTGLVTPVREIAALCRDRGIVSVVDGAHPPGLMPVDLEALGMDFYASSPHKWLLAPQGTGLLYMRPEWRTKLWPTLASGDWDDLSLGAQRFNHLGTLDESRLAGLAAALAFHRTIGPERAYARIRALRSHLADALGQLRGLHIVSPPDGDMVAGMVSFKLDGVESLALQKTLETKHNVRTRVIGEYDYGWMRLSPHIYNSPEELDRLVGLIAEAA